MFHGAMCATSNPEENTCGLNSLRSDVLSQEAAVSQQPRPQLDSHDAKNEKHKEAEEKDVSEHGQGVQQQRHQDPHTCTVERQKRFFFTPCTQNTDV